VFVSENGAQMLSRRVADALLGRKESWTRRMFELAGQLRRDGGGPVHDLSLGNPSLEPPSQWKRAVHEALESPQPGQHRYMTNAGFPEVRANLAARESRRYGVSFAADDVCMTVGAAGALNVLFRAMLDAGDQVAVPAPYFSEYEHYCANVGAELRPVPTTAEFELDLEALEAALQDARVRILLLNSPNNPTGAVYSAASLRALAGLLERLNARRSRPIAVLEDSPYRDLMHDGSQAASMLSVYAHTILVTSHSKDLGLAGERIGYLAISPAMEGRAVLARAAALCNRVLGFVNAPALMQRALPAVLDDPRARVEVEVYAKHCRAMAEGLVALGFHLPTPMAGFFLFPRLPPAWLEEPGADVTMTDKLLAHRTIVVPGTAFGAPGHLRLSMATSDAAVQGALEAFAAVCSARASS